MKIVFQKTKISLNCLSFCLLSKCNEKLHFYQTKLNPFSSYFLLIFKANHAVCSKIFLLIGRDIYDQLHRALRQILDKCSRTLSGWLQAFFFQSEPARRLIKCQFEKYLTKETAALPYRAFKNDSQNKLLALHENETDGILLKSDKNMTPLDTMFHAVPKGVKSYSNKNSD